MVLIQRQPPGLRTEAYTKSLTGDAKGLRIGIVNEGIRLAELRARR